MKLFAENISFSWNKEKFLNDISFELGENSIITVSGEIGSGKSTFLFILSGLLPPDSGKICVGENTQDVVPFVGLVRQDIFSQTVFTSSQKELRFSACLRKQPLEDNLILKTMHEWSLKDKCTYGMSHSDLLNLFTAGFLVSGKKFILFDEVFVNLSSAERQNFIGLVSENCVGSLFVTQFPSFFKGFTQKNFLIENGRMKVLETIPGEESYLKIIREVFSSGNCHRLQNTLELSELTRKMMKNKPSISFLPSYSERLFFSGSIREEVLFRGLNRDVFLDRAIKAGFSEEIMEADPFRLSSGQRRVLAFCLSLSALPKCLFIENPLLHLDSKRILWLAEQLEQFISSGGEIYFTAPEGIL
ncbi:ATP-binding cassette domain-containing protein [candidate division WOR-3 bacterium]|nr:ATP-binding cassette domain-containing protein [candidate division WOR-3 bacterium]